MPFGTRPFGTSWPRWQVANLPATSWPDRPSLINGGILLGANNHNHATYTAASYVASESAASLNRKNWLTHWTQDGDIVAPADLGSCSSLLDGSLLGHSCIPIISIFGFGSATANWPAGGLADFTSGSMDSTLAAWAALFNALPRSPVFLRLFREMSGTGVIYGTNGAANGGVNETPLTYIAAWKYVVAYFRARCPWVRFIWCPGVGTSSSNPAGERAMMRSTDWYPGNAYVDWIGTDVYVQANLYTGIAAHFALTYQALNPLNGLFAAATGYGTNLLSNACTSSTTTGWAGIGGGSVAGDATNFLYGTGSVSMTSTGNSSGAGLLLSPNPASGDREQVAVWIWCPAASVGKNLTLRLFDTTNFALGSNQVTLHAGWQSIDLTYTIPAGSHAIRCDLLSAGGAQGTFSWSANNVRVYKVPAQASGADGVGRPPFMICETGVDINDPARIADVQAYTAALTATPGVSAVSFWDQLTGQQFAIQDTPAGWLAAFQAVVAASPFAGAPV